MSDPQQADLGTAYNSTLAIAAAAAVVVLGIAVHLSIDAARSAAPWTNNDSAFHLYVAEQMNAGARLYIDWQDNNPPTIFFVALTAVRLGRLMGVPSLFGYDLVALCGAIVGLSVLVHSLRGMNRPWPAVAMAAAGYLFFVQKPGSITRDFGQREYLFALFLIPELFAIVSPRRMPWRPAWCAALAFMAMMKPQFVAIVVLLEITAPRQSRLRAVDGLGLVAGALAPFGILWWHSSASLTALFTDTLSLYLSGAYALLNRSPAILLRRGPILAFSSALAALAAMAWAAAGDKRIRGLVVRGAVAMAWSVASIVQQQKYFPYHFVPLYGLALVCGAWATGEWLSARRQPALAGVSSAALVLVGMMFFHADVSANADPLAVRLGRVIGPEARSLVVSVYYHELCVPYREAPRCIGPRAQELELPSLARAADSDEQLRHWAAGVAKEVREQRPEVLVISTADSAMPRGLTPATLLLNQFPIVSADEYLPLSMAAEARVQPRGWIILRRRDVAERPVH